MLHTILIALGLTMDSFAISGAISLGTRKAITAGMIIRVSSYFTLFQFSLLILGWKLGNILGAHINSYAKIVASCLLFIIGIKMILESQSIQFDKPNAKDISKGIPLILLSIATSIDAFAVGISLGLLKATITLPAITLAIATAIMSVLGLVLGRQLGKMIDIQAELVGGIILIALGIKTLFA